MGKTQTLEFYGGPVDGHAEDFCIPIRSFLLIKAALDQCIGFLSKLLQLVFFHSDRQSLVVAVYELKTQGCKCGYYYLRSHVANDASIDSTHVCVMAQASDQSLKPTTSTP